MNYKASHSNRQVRSHSDTCSRREGALYLDVVEVLQQGDCPVQEHRHQDITQVAVDQTEAQQKEG